MTLKVFRLQSINDRFQVICNIGKGSYGAVQKCKDIVTREIVAVKRIIQPNRPKDFPTQREGQPGQPGQPNECPQTTTREILLLQKLDNENIVRLKFVVQTQEFDAGLYLVFEYCEYDLYALLYKKCLEKEYMLSLMKQLLFALHACSVERIVHRDLKPANIFVTKNNVLKLGDFGLARMLNEHPRYSNQVVTLWYRPPELLVGIQQYGMEVDIWSAGCILYEMATSKVLFRPQKNSDILELSEIFKLCGRPRKDWIGFRGQNKDVFDNIKETIPKESKLKSFFDSTIPLDYGPDFVDLLMKMLTINPEDRITIEDALNHPFIRSIDSTYDPYKLPQLDVEEIHQLIVSEEKEEKKRLQNLAQTQNLRPARS